MLRKKNYFQSVLNYISESGLTSLVLFLKKYFYLMPDIYQTSVNHPFFSLRLRNLFSFNSALEDSGNLPSPVIYPIRLPYMVG